MLSDLLAGPLAAAPQSTALVFGNQHWTFAQLGDAVEVLARRLAGITAQGDRVAVVADNGPDVAFMLLAAPRAGLVLTPLNVRLAPTEMLAQLERAEPSVLVATGSYLAGLEAAAGGALAGRTGLSTIADLDQGDLEVLDSVDRRARPLPEHLDGEEPAWLIFTSGTTGPAKGAVLTHASLAAGVAVTAGGRPLADDDVYLYPFPLFHVSAYNVLHAWSRGRPVVLLPRFDAAVVLQQVHEHRVTVLSLAPTMLRMLLDHPAHDEVDLSSLRVVQYGAAPMPESLLREAAAALGCGFAQGYGLTETSGNAVFLGPEAHARGLAGEAHILSAAGWPGPGVELRVVGDDGHDVPTGSAGEVWLRGEQVCAGYWRDPEATEAAIVDGGWLRTGDIGVLDAEGLLTIVDRAKDIVVTGGENVASREVEDALCSHPAVAQAAVIGLPDERWGERICGVVVLREGVSPEGLEEELVDHCTERLGRFKKPRQLEFVDDLPVNAGGKVDKRALRTGLVGVPPR